MLLLLLLRNKFVVLNSTEGRIYVRTQFSVVLISTENEKRVTSPRHSPPYFSTDAHREGLNVLLFVL